MKSEHAARIDNQYWKRDLVIRSSAAATILRPSVTNTPGQASPNTGSSSEEGAITVFDQGKTYIEPGTFPRAAGRVEDPPGFRRRDGSPLGDRPWH
jgi:hypothetical protein